jgi:hypothetical protein
VFHRSEMRRVTIATTGAQKSPANEYGRQYQISERQAAKVTVGAQYELSHPTLCPEEAL